MARLAKYDEAEIGDELVRARDDGVPWKVLMIEYELGRTRLWQLYDAALQRRGREAGHQEKCS